jgi:hypothetical protein
MNEQEEPTVPGGQGKERQSRDGAESTGRDRGRTPDPSVAGAAVAAEEERFDGLVNEPGNPPRQPGLDARDEEARDAKARDR